MKDRVSIEELQQDLEENREEKYIDPDDLRERWIWENEDE